MERFFASCPRGLETVLARELDALGAQQVSRTEGGVAFTGTLQTMYRANLCSRIASRVLWRIGSGRYHGEEDLYRAARTLEWDRFFAVDRTMRVNVSAVRSPLRSLDFVTLRIKDAVCDRFREAFGERPNVDTARPDVRVHVFLTEHDYTFYLDTSGEALFKRGYRQHAGEAPLRENLAAGILALAGWTPAEEALLDPMCGSATFLIEAARAALGMPAGAERRFGFEKLNSFDAQCWARVRETAAQPAVPAPLRIFGSDVDGDALESARRNLIAAGVERSVRLERSDVRSIAAPAARGVLIANPPYGVRLGDQRRVAEFYPELGNALKRNFAGWRAYVFTADLRLPKLIGLRPSKRIVLYNGPLECRLYEFRMVAGSMRRARIKEEG
ncbi:MAG TPA: THUMP domain-containing protein [Burkholderiales bacterium]|jgi:putative N6-adenine-specific DNA methylase|nr:THUMP domain-containing protein [Burkholderiales bacterium]